MRVIIEDRVEQAFRHMQPAEAEKVTRVLRALHEENFQDFRIRFPSYKLALPGQQVFVIRATPKWRILFNYGDEQTLIIEDIVSHEILEKFFGGRHG